jgi:hypothetical protein
LLAVCAGTGLARCGVLRAASRAMRCGCNSTTSTGGFAAGGAKVSRWRANHVPTMPCTISTAAKIVHERHAREPGARGADEVRTTGEVKADGMATTGDDSDLTQ